MSYLKSDPLMTARQELLRALDVVSRQHPQWPQHLHRALGHLAAAIQEDVQAAERSMEMFGDINPDFQNAPVTERHMQTTRDQLIKLSEQVYQLRADVRKVRKDSVLDSVRLHMRGQEVCIAVEKVRQADNEFLQTTLNTNLGAGE